MEDDMVLKFEKRESIILSIGFVILYPILAFFSSWLVFMFSTINGDVLNTKHEMYYNVILVVLSLIIFLKIIPDELGIKKSNYKNFLKEIGISFNKKACIVTLMIIISSAVSSIILPPKGINITLLITRIRPAVSEELIFRGIIIAILLNSFPKKFASIFAVIFSTLLFIPMHVMLGWAGILGATGGIFFAILAVDTRSIFPSMAMHYALVTFGVSVGCGLNFFFIGYIIFLLVRYGMSLFKNIKVKNEG